MKYAKEEILLFCVMFVFLQRVPQTLSVNTDFTCSHKVADIVFALDSSGSIWEEDFKTQLHFVQDIIKDFPVRKNGVHIGIVTYGSRIYENFGLTTYFTEPEMMSAIGRIQYLGGGTNTGGVIKYARERMFNKDNGGRKVDQIMFVITDGYSMDSENTTMEASISKSYGIKMIALGVGHNFDEKELNYIATADGEKKLMFRVDGFSALETIKSILAKVVCQVIHTEDTMIGDAGYSNKSQVEEESGKQYCGGKPADVYFVVDASSSIWVADFEKMLQFVANTTDTFNLGPSATRVGVVVYSNGIHPVIAINNQYDRAELKRRILNIKHLRGGTATGSALEYLRVRGFSKDVSREGVAHIAIIMTDGQSLDTKKTMSEAAKLQKVGAYLYVIGIGRQVDENELRAIASDPTFLYLKDSFGALSSIQNILEVKPCEGQNEEQKPEYTRNCEPSSEVDVMFTFDAFTLGRNKSNSLSNVIEDIIITTTHPRVRTGVRTHSCNSIKSVPLSANKQRLDMSKGLNPDQSDTLPNLLNDIRTINFVKEAREGSYTSKLVVLFIDGNSNLNYYHRIKTEISRLTFGNHTFVYIVGIGGKPDTNLQDFAAASMNVKYLHVNSYTDMLGPKTAIVDKICGSSTQ